MEFWLLSKGWAEKYMPTVKAILGIKLIQNASAKEDQRHNTDFALAECRVACRLRRPEYMARYPNEFTIRVRQKLEGGKSELVKIIDGWGDIFFYGFVAREGSGLEKWLVGSLPVFRKWWMEQLQDNYPTAPGRTFINRDQSSVGVAFKVSELPRDFIIADGGPFDLVMLNSREDPIIE